MAIITTIKDYRAIGNSEGARTRIAVSYTPASDMTLRHWTFTGMRFPNLQTIYTGETLTTVTAITWEVRTAAANHKPNTTSASLLDTGTFDWRYSSVFKHWRPIQYTINLAEGLPLTGSVEYWFILKMPDDAEHAEYPLAWCSTYDTGAAGEVDAAVYVSEFISGTGWTNGDNSVNLTLSITDPQAGFRWHVVIDGSGYMQPEGMRGYVCEQVASGLAQSRGGQSERSQLRYPYSNLMQDSWISGGGQLEQDDPNAFLYAVSTDTTVDHQAMLGPLVHHTGTSSANPEYDPTSIQVRHLPDPEHSTTSSVVVYYAQKFTTTTQVSMTTMGLKINREPWQRKFTASVALYSDSSGSPGSALTSWTNFAPTFGWAWRDVSLTYTLAATTSYWVVVKTNQTWGAFPEHRVAFDQNGSAGGGAAKYSANGTAWTALSVSMAFRVNYGAKGALNGDVVAFAWGSVNSADGFYCAAGKEVYKWNTETSQWGALSAALTANATDLIIFNGKLHVAQGLSYNAQYYDTSWHDTGDAFNYFHISHGYMWASDAVNTIRHSNDGTTWTAAAITVGTAEYAITDLITYNGEVIVGKENGLWRVDTTTDLSSVMYDFSGHAHPDNCKGMAVWSGMLYVPVEASIWRWQGSQYREVGPSDGNAGPTGEWPNRIMRMVPTAPLLFAAAEPLISTGWGGLMAYNGVGWHYLTKHNAENMNSRAIYVTTELGTDETRIWYGDGAKPAYVTWPQFTNNRYDWSSADYMTIHNTLVLSWWDGGLKDALKFWNRMTMIADIPSGTSIECYFVADGGDWNTSADYMYLGELTIDQLTDTGEYTLMFPDGLIAKSIQLIFLMFTTSSSLTPRIRAINVESLVRQVPVYSYSFRILIGDNIMTIRGEDDPDSRDANDLWEALQRAAAKNEPILISFPGRTIRGVISSLREQTHQFAPSGTQSEKWERIASLTIIEAT